MIAKLKTKRALIPILAAIVAWLSGIQIVRLTPQPLFMLGTLGGGVVGWLIFRWFVTKVRLVGALSVIGVAILSGFLGSFVGVIDFISPLYNTVRWIAPLLLMMIGIRNALQAKKVTQYLITSWGSISIPILCFMLYALSSVLYSSAPLITTGRVVTFITITIGLAAALWPIIRQQADAERILRVIALVMALIILPGEWYIFFPGSIGWHSSGRFRSTFWNPVTFSHLCALLLPLYWWIAVDRRVTSGWRTASRAMIAILIVNIYLTRARSGGLALLVSVFFLSWHFTAQKSRHLVNWLLIAMLTFTIILQPQVMRNYLTRGSTLDDAYQLTSSRMVSWELALLLWSNSPILGSGFGVIGNTDESLLSSSGSSALQSRTAGLRLSNLYLETLASGGLIGAGLLLYLLFKCLMMFWRALEHATEEKRLMMLMSFTIFISGLILNLFETWLISAGSPFAMYWWLVLFLASRVASLDGRPQKNPHLVENKTGQVGMVNRSVPALPPQPLIVWKYINKHNRDYYDQFAGRKGNSQLRILIHALAVRQHGGTARHLMNFIPALGRYGADNQYLLYVDQDALLPTIPSNVTVYRESVRASWRRVLWDVRRLPAIAKQEEVDAVWNLLGFGMLDTSVPQIMFQRAPGYYCRHYLDAVERRIRWQSALRRWWQAVIMRRSAHIITPTAAMREMIRHHHPDLPLSHFSVVPHAFNPAALEGELTADMQEHFAALPAEAVKLLYVGHILPYKDLLFMLDVFAEALKKADKPLYWYLTIAPQDWASGYDAFMAKRRDDQLEDHVIVLGKLPGSVVGALYKRCDIVLFTSLCESFGWPMLEATSLSKPLLAVDTPLNREMIGSGALYYAYQDHAGAVNRLLELVSDKQKQLQLGQAGYQHFEKTHFDWQKYVGHCHDITQKALTG